MNYQIILQHFVLKNFEKTIEFQVILILMKDYGLEGSE